MSVRRAVEVAVRWAGKMHEHWGGYHGRRTLLATILVLVWRLGPLGGTLDVPVGLVLLLLVSGVADLVVEVRDEAYREELLPARRVVRLLRAAEGEEDHLATLDAGYAFLPWLNALTLLLSVTLVVCGSILVAATSGGVDPYAHLILAAWLVLELILGLGVEVLRWVAIAGDTVPDFLNTSSDARTARLVTALDPAPPAQHALTSGRWWRAGSARYFTLTRNTDMDAVLTRLV